ncbi:GNAT family N-acetyltransferase [Rhodanobacter sp. OK091]|uniref:GNAT family N-acetyltransferase n=1 Tax=Rhodanobacter sp. OK091 TaxID=1881037 RepID=UPI00091B57DF|nr:GNAT family N-acetyltransferase [Rhodanobacter sp. OK091]SHL81683.1 Acetyltransferase (GNAT) domain-containing protein [Rhodanobacter sp. OK091]
MNAMLINVPGHRTSRVHPLQITRAAPWDILFFLTEVESGAAERHFIPEISFSQKVQNALALRCAKAILGGVWGLGRLFKSDQFKSDQFVVVRRGNQTLGAALASTDCAEGGRKTVTIEYLVVESRFRRQGVGEALVRHFQANATDGSEVCAYCTAQSKGMQKLLRGLDFKCSNKAISIPNGKITHYLPSCWIWRR